MKNILTIILLISGIACNSQSLNDINSSRIKKTKSSMYVLGGWSIANIASGMALRGDTGTEEYYFHTMNAGWNAVNLGISVLGYIGLNREDYSQYNFAETVKKQNGLQTAYLINSALDLAYITGGFWMIERGKNSNDSNRFTGFGKSIILQGGFLFLLDVISFVGHISEDKKIHEVLQQVNLTANGLSIKYKINY